MIPTATLRQRKGPVLDTGVLNDGATFDFDIGVYTRSSFSGLLNACTLVWEWAPASAKALRLFCIVVLRGGLGYSSCLAAAREVEQIYTQRAVVP
jgi:hypothetical protein